MAAANAAARSFLPPLALLTSAIAAAVFCRLTEGSDPASVAVGLLVAAVGVFFFFDALAFGDDFRGFLSAGDCATNNPLPLTPCDDSTGAGRFTELDFVDLDPFDFLPLLFMLLVGGGCGWYMGGMWCGAW